MDVKTARSLLLLQSTTDKTVSTLQHCNIIVIQLLSLRFLVCNQELVCRCRAVVYPCFLNHRMARR